MYIYAPYCPMNVSKGVFAIINSIGDLAFSEDLDARELLLCAKEQFGTVDAGHCCYRVDLDTRDMNKWKFIRCTNV